MTTLTEPTPKRAALPTIWEVPDPLWAIVERALTIYDPPSPMGRPRINQRLAFNGIIYRMRTGCQWGHLPTTFGDGASIHRTLQRWESKGIFDILWAVLLMKCDESQDVNWHWQSADGCTGKARGIPKKGARRNASVPTPPTGPKRASRRVSLSKEEVARLLCALPEQTSTTLNCLPQRLRRR